MLKVNCSNAGCGETYYFNDERFPNATKVKCPKCGHVQPRDASAANGAAKKEDDMDWFKPPVTPVVASPQLEFDTPSQPSFISEPPPPSTDEEDFFTPVKKAEPKPVEPKRAAVAKPTPSPMNRDASTVSRVSNAVATDAIGWLVIHDEYTEARTFALRKGLNRIGRATDTTPRDVNIAIETKDNYMSRHHCDIEVKQKLGVGGYEYVLSDRDYGGKKASANGTYLNARKRLSSMDETNLQDNDTIQVGRTKLVLKLPTGAENAQDAAAKVRSTDFFQTIIN
jgi:hypothetical protein